ncbi:amyloid-beta-like protein isoform X3 [Hermetia illucens]|uniref:amyloid-beta-like protein isoform X3 n=1 Tax=Hermetia illucens TaxID=343691 RepID=UPI0018CC516D|nr:amyloid-beta-like protein isoform X3 [Hermetia illucens]
MPVTPLVLVTLFALWDIETFAVQGASLRWEPQIAVLCEAGQGYYPQHLSEEGRWATDLNVKPAISSCLRDKIDLLNYCKKVYPNRDITNIVESSHYQKIGGWCRQNSINSSKCKGAQRWIKPFRCLEGPFQSDALLVPEGCLFDHIHNASRCWPFVRWNQTGAAACQERGMQMRSFAMLLPCGISLFSGVEFVCCPKHFKADTVRVKKIDLPQILPEAMPSAYDDDSQSVDDDATSDDILADEALDNNGDDGDEYYSDESDLDRDSDDSAEIRKAEAENAQQMSNNAADNAVTDLPSAASTPPAKSESPLMKEATVDPYFTHFDPRLEHQSYKAQQRLEETHREKVTRVMKDWSDLEEKYQDMRLADPKAAQSFKQRMTARFQVGILQNTSVQALEEEGNAEKHQLAAMHQQRVLAHINQRKREAMTCYTQALTEQPPNAHRVEKCLQKLLRALHKDRAHALAHYRHLLTSGGTGGLEAAASERPRTLERLIDIDRAVNQSMTMLKRYPELSSKISQLMNDYIQALRSKDDIPGSMLGMSEEAEIAILDKYFMEVEHKVKEKERLRLAEKQRKEQRAAEREKLREEKLRMEAKKLEDLVKQEEKDNVEGEKSNKEPSKKYLNHKESQNVGATEATTSPKSNPTVLPTVDDAAVQRAVEEVAAAVAHQEAEPRMQHIMVHDFDHGESNYAVRHEIYGSSDRGGRNAYFTLTFAGVALLGAIFVGVAVAKWRASRSPHAQGFIEVDQTVGMPITPEERHVANMQINGYENPTYKYFEVKE